MKKIICDRCGKEIERVVNLGEAQNICASKLLSDIHYKLTSSSCCSLVTRTYDLCDDCQHDLTDWLNNGREEEK